MFTEIELDVSEETNKMNTRNLKEIIMQQLLRQHKALTQNVVPSEPQLGSSRTLNVSDLLLPRSQAMSGIGPAASNLRKQSLKI
jgi:hypothetical protein